MSGVQEKKKWRRRRSDARIAAALIPVILVLGFSISWLAGYGLIPIDASIILPLTFVGIILVICFLMGSLSSTDAGRKAPKFRVVDSYSRVVKDPSKDKEYIVEGTGDMTVREALLFDWVFKDRNKNSEWYALDDHGTDVSEKLLADFEGVINMEFRD